MKPGALGELIADRGQIGLVIWGPSAFSTEATVIYLDGRDRPEAMYWGDQDVRLERVASFIGYLEDERKA